MLGPQVESVPPLPALGVHGNDRLSVSLLYHPRPSADPGFGPRDTRETSAVLWLCMGGGEAGILGSRSRLQRRCVLRLLSAFQRTAFVQQGGGLRVLAGALF